MDSNGGTSLVLVNSSKGKEKFIQLKDYISYAKQTIEQAQLENNCLTKSCDMISKDSRSQFFMICT
jgi:hypothetical protein